MLTAALETGAAGGCSTVACMFSRRALPLLASAALALVWSGGCSDEADESAVEIVARAAEQTAAAEGMHITMQVTASGTGVGDGEVMAMSADQAADGSSLVGEMDMAGETIDVLLVDGSYFYAFPGLPDGKEWAEVTLEQLAAQGLDVTATQGQDSSQTLSLLEAAGDVEETGEDEIDGDAVTLYRALVNVAEMNDEVVTGELREQMLGLLGEEIEMEVAIDEDGYVRRMDYSVDLAEAPDPPDGVPTSGRLRYWFEMSDFTDDYQAPERPDPDEVLPLPELQLGG